MQKPQFHKDSWYGVIGDTFTTRSLRQAALGISEWMNTKGFDKVFLAYDTRFGGKMFANSVANMLAISGKKCAVSSTYLTTAALILNMVKLDADIGVMITGSDQNAEISGLKLIGVQKQEDIDLINGKIPNEITVTHTQEKLFTEIPMEDHYLRYLNSEIDIEAIKKSGLLIVLDAMYGASQDIFTKLLPVSMKLRCEVNPSFKGDPSTLTTENLKLLCNITQATTYAAAGVALDSDATQLFMCDEEGQQINPYKILHAEENIPWRDGLYIALKIIEKMAASGRKLSTFS